MKKFVACACLLVTMTALPLMAASTYTMGYTPAGGVTVNPAGGPPGAVPALYSYSGFNPSAYQTLYYGVNYVANVAQAGGGTGNMAFQGYNPTTGVLGWTSTQNWVFTGTNCSYNGPTQFIMQIQPLTGTPGFIGSGFLIGQTTTKGALGISTGSPSDPLFQVVGGGSFQTTFQFLTWDGSPSDIGQGTDIADYYNGCQGGADGQFMTSVDFEFWWSVPKTTAKIVQVGTCKTNLKNYATIQTAINAVPAGATVEVCPGTYNEQLNITEAITLEGLTSGTNSLVVLIPPSVFEQSGSIGPYPVYAQIFVQDASPVNISGLTVDGNNSGCPNGAIAGIVYLSSANPSSGKVSNSVVRNTGNGCSGFAVGIYAQNDTASTSAITVQGNSIHNINGQGINFGPNMGGSILSNTISQANGGIAFQQAGPNLKATGNNISSVQNGLSLNNATGVTAQTNLLSNINGTAIALQDSSGGTNNFTKNTINEANCGISTSQTASTDVYFPNTVLNANNTTCQ